MASSREELLSQHYLRQLSIDDYQRSLSHHHRRVEGEGSFHHHPSFQSYEPRHTEEPQSSLDEPVPLQNDPQQQLPTNTK
ncbi:hypothetical protein B0H65DRAFT_452170 [Neurospora tetraspora]|uniref:Uncharacterized protein n=1 Tax=Neurospora tetraspora TaxID=94610 RepID=A0AAE0JQI1_9PEZI|nr:hypothetical protein B0H65DRAFT_452170 [Neurospora tetraspora]